MGFFIALLLLTSAINKHWNRPRNYCNYPEAQEAEIKKVKYMADSLLDTWLEIEMQKEVYDEKNYQRNN